MVIISSSERFFACSSCITRLIANSIIAPKIKNFAWEIINYQKKRIKKLKELKENQKYHLSYKCDATNLSYKK